MQCFQCILQASYQLLQVVQCLQFLQEHIDVLLDCRNWFLEFLFTLYSEIIVSANPVVDLKGVLRVPWNPAFKDKLVQKSLLDLVLSDPTRKAEKYACLKLL